MTRIVTRLSRHIDAVRIWGAKSPGYVTLDAADYDFVMRWPRAAEEAGILFDLGYAFYRDLTIARGHGQASYVKVTATDHVGGVH